MKYKDYYEILGVQRTATQREINHMYRTLAGKYHRDASERDVEEDGFKEVSEAYHVLADMEKHAAYDLMGTKWRNGQKFEPLPDWDEGFMFIGADNEASDGVDFSHFFETMFGGGRAAARARQGETRGTDPNQTAISDVDLENAYQGKHRPIAGRDHHTKVVIDLEDAYRGAQRSISLRTPIIDARDRVSLTSRAVNVFIPRGARVGQNLRLAGQGGAGLGGGPDGDLYLQLAFRDHPRFRVDGLDVSLCVPVAPWEAALGATMLVPMPDGSVEIIVPPCSTGGRRLRLEGKGIPSNPPGDLEVILDIVVPPADSDKAKAVYDMMRQAFTFDPRAGFYSGQFMMEEPMRAF
ncbi:DnaJ C-terminal domain-containing protein [Paraburkholderia terrae]|uniref:DnaJ C-terminal domain-containing protein n=1 Tax=Paraburkholderia terrae TaxID=311230 RepID=UPI0030DEB337